MASNAGEFIIRVRTRAGMWRFNVSNSTTVLNLRQRITRDKGIPLEQQRLSLDQVGASPADDSAQLGALGLGHGDLLYLHTSDTVSNEMVHITSKGVKKTIGKGGVILPQDFETAATKKGFRPGLRDLRSMKMHWTLAEFAALDAQYNFKVTAPKESVCKQVSLNGDACNVFQMYVRSYAFAPRCGYLFGRYDEENSKTIVDVIYEPPQQVDASGELCLSEYTPDDLPLDSVLQVASSLGLQKVGWIFSHPYRNASSDSENSDEDDEYRFTAFELLESAEQQMEACGGSLSNVDKCKFVTVVVTANAEGMAEFDAFQCSPLCLQMTDAGALLEHEEKPGCCKVSETFTALVEGKPATAVSTSYFLSVVAIVQHKVSGLTCTFPIANRENTPLPNAALRSRLVNCSRQPHAARVADFQALLALVPIMGLESVLDLCKSVINPEVPVKEGYKLIIDSLVH